MSSSVTSSLPSAFVFRVTPNRGVSAISTASATIRCVCHSNARFALPSNSLCIARNATTSDDFKSICRQTSPKSPTTGLRCKNSERPASVSTNFCHSINRAIRSSFIGAFINTSALASAAQVSVHKSPPQHPAVAHELNPHHEQNYSRDARPHCSPEDCQPTPAHRLRHDHQSEHP